MSSPALALSNSSPPAKFPICWAQNAGPSYVRAIPTASQIGIQNGAASLSDGYPPLNFLPIAAGGAPPFGQDMNGILRQISCWSQWQNAGGTVAYDGSFSTSAGGYPLNAILAASNSGNFWLNTSDANTTNPDSGGAGWLGFSPIYPYVIDAGTANAGSSTLPVTISSLATIVGRPISVKKTSATNTGAYSLSLNGYTAFVHRIDGTSLTNGDLPGSGIFTVIFDGTYFELQSPTEAQTLGSAAAKSATNTSSSYLSSVIGSTTNQHVAIFSDSAGSITDSGWNINQLAPLNSPSFVGSPTAPTQVSSDNSTKLATTAFVTNKMTSYQSSQISVSNGTSGDISLPFNANSGTVIAQIVLICISPDNGYSPGDVIIDGYGSNGSGNGLGHTLSVSGTTAHWVVEGVGWGLVEGKGSFGSAGGVFIPNLSNYRAQIRMIQYN